MLSTQGFLQWPTGLSWAQKLTNGDYQQGNDAAYTLQAMIGICFKRRRNREELTKERDARMEDAAEEAKEQAKQDPEEWSEADNEEGDGGEPVRLISQEPTLNPRSGGSKVNRAERLAREKLEAKKRKEQDEASSGDVDTWDTKNAATKQADQGVAMSSNAESKKLGNETTPAADGWLSNATGQHAALSTDGPAKMDDHGQALSADQGRTKLADQQALTSNDQSLKPSDGIPATADRASSGSGFGFNGTEEMSARETSRAGLSLVVETPNPPQASTIDGVDEESTPSAYMLERLALLEAWDAEDGGVRL